MRVRSIVVLVVCVLSLAGCDYLISSRWNYRITVTVETPEGVRTGSAVRQVEGWRQPWLNPDAPGVLYRMQGEAVVVDLGERGQLFALISWDSYSEVYAAIPSDLSEYAAVLRHYRSLKHGTKGELPRESYPRLVTFADLNDPKSVRAVDPDAFHEAFGEGVRIKEIVIEITGDPVTFGIVDRFLPVTFNAVIKDGWRDLRSDEKRRLVDLTTFKQGEQR